MRRLVMTTHNHPHHHSPGEAHPPSPISLSLLRMSAWERLAIAAVVVALLWGTAIWATF